jgi:ABC-type multidrug transport system ATPase subunit
MTHIETALPLSIKNVSKTYGQIHANDHISLEISRGTITGLLGPNGAGKTTLIRICAGLLQPDEGTVLIDGIQQSLTSLQARARFGIVSKDVSFYKELTVEETLQLQATLYGLHGDQRRHVLQQALEEYRLSDFSRRRIGVLSTGMLQRVAIAAAMLHKPVLLLLDEPTIGLDPEVRQHIWDCLLLLRSHGVAMLLTTHYLEEAAALCDTVNLLIDGSIAMTMTPSTDNDAADLLKQKYLSAVQHEQQHSEVS